MKTNIAEKSLKVLLFNGKASNFNYWRPKFAARAWKKKTSPIFLGTILVSPESEYVQLFLLPKLVEQTLRRKLPKILILTVRRMMN